MEKSVAASTARPETGSLWELWRRRPRTVADMQQLLTHAAAPEGTDLAPAGMPATSLTDNRRGQPYQLVLRFAAFNIAAFALLGAAYVQGWVHRVVEADSTALSIGIFIVFLGGLAACGREISNVSIELNNVHSPRPARESLTQKYLAEIAGRDAGSRALIAAALRTRLAGRIAFVRYVANSLVLLGLIGTVLGFVIALSAVDPEVAGDVSKITPMVAKLIQGMSVALYTTLVGAVLHLWLSVNYHFLAVGAARFATYLVVRGESDA